MSKHLFKNRKKKKEQKKKRQEKDEKQTLDHSENRSKKNRVNQRQEEQRDLGKEQDEHFKKENENSPEFQKQEEKRRSKQDDLTQKMLKNNPHGHDEHQNKTKNKNELNKEELNDIGVNRQKTMQNMVGTNKDNNDDDDSENNPEPNNTKNKIEAEETADSIVVKNKKSPNEKLTEQEQEDAGLSVKEDNTVVVPDNKEQPTKEEEENKKELEGTVDKNALETNVGNENPTETNDESAVTSPNIQKTEKAENTVENQENNEEGANVTKEEGSSEEEIAGDVTAEKKKEEGEEEELSPIERVVLASKKYKKNTERLAVNGQRIADVGAKSIHYTLPKRLVGRRNKMLERQTHTQNLANGYVSDTLKKGTDLIDKINAAKPILQAESEKIKTKISEQVQLKLQEATTNTEAQKLRVEGNSETLKQHVNKYYYGSVATIKANTNAQLAKVKAEWGQVQKDMITGRDDHIKKFLPKFYKNYKDAPQLVANAKGAQAHKYAIDRAIIYQNQRKKHEHKNGEAKSDGMFTGPYSYNVLTARISADMEVGKEFEKAYIKKGKELAETIENGEKKDSETIEKYRQDVHKNILNYYNKIVKGIRDQEKSFLSNVAQQRRSYIDAIDKRETVLKTELDGQFKKQEKDLKNIELAQRSAVDERTLNTIADLDRRIIKATNNLIKHVEDFITYQNGQEIPDVELLEQGLLEQKTKLDGQMGAIAQNIDSSIQGVSTTIAEAGKSANKVIADYAKQANEKAVKTVDDTDEGNKQLMESSKTSQLRTRYLHLKAAKNAVASAHTGFVKSLAGYKKGVLTVQIKMLEALLKGIKGFKTAFDKSMKDPEKGLWAIMDDNEKKAVSKVEPRWKTWLKVLAIVVIIIIVIVLSIVTMGAAVPALAGAMGIAAGTIAYTVTAIAVGVVVGAIGGLIIQVGTNAVNGDPLMKDWKKAMAIGAIGGLFGGAGSAFAKGLGFGLEGATAASHAIGFTIEGVFDIAGGVLGNVLFDDEAWKGVWEGAGWGLVMNIVMTRITKNVKIKPSLAGAEPPKTRWGQVKNYTNFALDSVAYKFGKMQDNLAQAGENVGKNIRQQITGIKPDGPKTNPDVIVPKAEVNTPKIDPPKVDPNIAPIKVDPNTTVPKTDVPTIKPGGETVTPKIDTDAPIIKPDSPTIKPNADIDAPKLPKEEIGFLSGKKNSTHYDAEADAEGVVSRHKIKGADGAEHEVKVTKKGEIIRCSVCDELEANYKDLLNKKENKHLKEELDKIRLEPDPQKKGERAAELTRQLENQKKPPSPADDLTPEQRTIFDNYKKRFPSTDLSDADIVFKIKRGDTINPTTGRFKKNPSKNVPDVPESKVKGTETKATDDMKAAKTKTDEEIDAIKEKVKDKSENDADYQKAKEESFQRRHPEEEALKKFEAEYEKKFGTLDAAPDKQAYLDRKNRLFEAARARARSQHSMKYDQGEINRLQGDAFENNYLDATKASGWKKPDPKEITFKYPEPDGPTYKRKPDLQNGDHYKELKSGRVSMSDDVTEQILKDAILVSKGKQVTWVFKEGASSSVLDLLKKHGINYIIL